MPSSDQSPPPPPPASGRWTPVFDEFRWVIHIRRTFEEELDEHEADGVPVSIFDVPKPLLQTKPEAYHPQIISLGPYHHWRPELHEMERYKLSAAKSFQRRLLAGTKFQDLVSAITKHERLIRAHYHRYLDFNEETLSWMMAVDACFMLEILQLYGGHEDARPLRRISSRMSHLLDRSGRKSAHYTMLRDMMMLENQIPLFLLHKILDWQRVAAAPPGEETLKKMLTAFLKELCPFKMMGCFPSAVEVAGHSHLLHILYRILVPKDDTMQENESEIDEDVAAEAARTGQGGGDWRPTNQLLTTLWGLLSSLNVKLVRRVKVAAASKPVRLVVTAPWTILTTIPGFSKLKKPVESLFSSDAGKNDGGDPDDEKKKPPRVEEISIPSVEELVASGVRFYATDGDLTTIEFDPATAVFSLPVVTLDSTTEVVLRNLVAYEASAATGPLVLARYTELMNGIVDTEEDVKILRKEGVVMNHMKSDAKAAELWNSMNRTVRLTKVELLDSAIRDVNKYYNGRWRVRTNRLMRKYVFGSWQLLTFLAALLLLLLTALQAFCSVYTCSRWYNFPAAGP